MCCRDPSWFTDGWLSRIKTDIEDNWRLKVKSKAISLILNLWVLSSFMAEPPEFSVCFTPANLSLTLTSYLLQRCCSWFSLHADSCGEMCPILSAICVTYALLCFMRPCMPFALPPPQTGAADTMIYYFPCCCCLFVCSYIFTLHQIFFVMSSDEQPKEDPSDGA